ncbi:hypothetical protein LX36DRAFT_371401 [Colletotrichum falcatum]|nr:hypothetical protein LX36DRAFT_371401 [Colletotrichum falcatum]
MTSRLATVTTTAEKSLRPGAYTQCSMGKMCSLCTRRSGLETPSCFLHCSPLPGGVPWILQAISSSNSVKTLSTTLQTTVYFYYPVARVQPCPILAPSCANARLHRNGTQCTDSPVGDYPMIITPPVHLYRTCFSEPVSMRLCVLVAPVSSSVVI